MYIFVILVLIKSIYGQLNLYLDSNSVQQLFGKSMNFIRMNIVSMWNLELNQYELYFIHDNQIRYAALKTPLLIPADVHFIQFTWNENRFDFDRVNFSIVVLFELFFSIWSQNYTMNTTRVRPINKSSCHQYWISLNVALFHEKFRVGKVEIIELLK